MVEAERLLTAALVEIQAVDPADRDAQFCLRGVLVLANEIKARGLIETTDEFPNSTHQSYRLTLDLHRLPPCSRRPSAQ